MREDLSARTKPMNADNDDIQSGAKSPLNMEYLKHVVIGFMENKQARVRVLSFATIFKFTSNSYQNRHSLYQYFQCYYDLVQKT